MKLKRYFAKDARQAIRMVRDELGPDAVILSNQRRDGGVEIVAAVDFELEEGLDDISPEQVEPSTAGQPEQNLTYDARGRVEQGGVAESRFEQLLGEAERGRRMGRSGGPVTTVKGKIKPVALVSGGGERGAAAPSGEDPALADMQAELRQLRGMLENQLSGLAWGELGRGCPGRIELLRRLVALGLGTSHCRLLVEQIEEFEDPDRAWHQALGLLAGQIRITGDDIVSKGGVVALVGPTGVGKTTTVAKLAARFALRHGYQEVALITTDGYRIAAHEQLRTYGRILGIPVQVVNNAEELRGVLEGFRDKRLVLIDTAGMGQRDLRLAGQFKTILSGAPQIRSYVLLAANVQREGLDEVAHAFSDLEPAGCILTKVDECVSLGGVLSVVAERELPVAYVSDGQRVPEDIHPARAEGLVERAAGLVAGGEEFPDDETMVLTMGGVVAHAVG